MVTTITTADLTTKAIDGTGVFDDLMTTIQVRLTQEYNKNRIQGTDYSKLYLGAITAVLQESIAFLLQKDTVAKQIDLLAAQINNEVLKGTALQAEISKSASEKALIDQQTANAFIAGGNLTEQGLELVAQTSLLAAQEAKLAGVDSLLVTATTIKTNSEKALIAQQATNALITGANLSKQGLELAAQTSLLTTQKAKLAGVDSLLITASIAKTNSEKTLVDDQAAKLLKDALLVQQQTANALLTANVIPKQANKLDAEIGLLSQKTDTEKAQILDTVNTLPVIGVIGKQKDLFTVQKEGFLRDAEQKLAKIVTDAWAIRTSVAPSGQFTSPAGVSDQDVTAILNTAKKGIKLPIFGVASVTIQSGGSGYLSAPTISFIGDGTGTTATAVILGGVVTQINITAGGSGYTTPPAIIITGTSTIKAAALAIL